MYSLGLILFELLRPFKTNMEKLNDLNDLKNHSKFPDSFEEQFEIHVLILNLNILITLKRNSSSSSLFLFKVKYNQIATDEKSKG